MTAALLSVFIVFLLINGVTVADIFSDDYIEDHVAVDELSPTFDDGFTTEEGVEIELPKHWINKEGKRGSELSPGASLSSIHGWTWSKDNSIPKLYAMDPNTRNFVRRNVQYALYSPVNCTAFKTKVKLAAFSKDVLTDLLVMDPTLAETAEFIHVFSGNGILDGRQPLAHRYGGHQFGSWAGQLGDGRAHTIGEVRDSSGASWEVQLKGSGKTPYSRDGDGRAVIRSSVREFLASEAMHYLGIPTSRAGSLVVSKDKVRRDKFYSGDIKEERTAMVMRLARSWLRFGTLELMSKNGEHGLLRSTLDTIIQQHYAEIDPTQPDRYVHFFRQVMENTLTMVVKWMCVGFAHGVMNTDNFSLHGITIDYGPFRFLDEYHPDVVPNTSDDEGRYSFDRQPVVARQNLVYLADALSPIVDQQQTSRLRELVQVWDSQYKKQYLEEMRKKLGTQKLMQDDIRDDYMVSVLFLIMKGVGADFTMTFRELSEWDLVDMKKDPEHIPEQLWTLQKLQKHEHWHHWLKEVYVPKLMQYYRPEGHVDRKRFEAFQNRYPNWTDENRRVQMKRVNPRYVLRNWMAQEAIEAAERDDFEPVRRLLRVLSSPYKQQWEAEDSGYAKPPPQWAGDLKQHPDD